MKFKTIKGLLGVSYIQKSIKLDPAENARDLYLSAFGLAAGLQWTPFGEFMHIAWESHLFSAGRSTVLLTSARQQTLTIAGAELVKVWKLICLVILAAPQSLWGSAVGFQAGATSTGSGGPNALGIPPQEQRILELAISLRKTLPLISI